MQAGFGTVYAVRRGLAGSGFEWASQVRQASLGNMRIGRTGLGDVMQAWRATPGTALTGMARQEMLGVVTARQRGITTGKEWTG